MGKRSRHKKVRKVWTLDENNMMELAEKLGQSPDDMAQVLLIAEINERSVHVIEYDDRFELQQTVWGS